MSSIRLTYIRILKRKDHNNNAGHMIMSQASLREHPSILIIGSGFGGLGMAIKLKLAKLPEHSNLMSLYGISALCGIGFTMSLFIGSLAYEETQFDMIFDERLGIIVGSLISALIGFFVIKSQLKKFPEPKDSD